jgi:hypothetical protein
MMSNIEQIEKSLKKLLKEKNTFVAMLSGEWGIGKTYFWKKLEKPNNRVAYISLFGHNLLDDIKTAIMSEVGMIEHKKFKEFTERTKDLQIFGVGVGGFFSMFTKEDLQDIVICFDDFERLSNKLDLKDVLGLISYLKEEKNCKIIMILNENELDTELENNSQTRSEIFAKKKEKIVDYSFYFKPSYDESFEIVKDDIKYFQSDWVKEFFKKINLKNIRIMKQVIYLLNHFAFIEKYALDDKVVKEFSKIALNLFVFKAKCNFSYKEYIDMCSYRFKNVEADIIASEYNIDIDIEENPKYEKCSSEVLELKSLNKEQIEVIVYDFIDTNLIDKEKLKSLLEENNKNIYYYKIIEEIASLIDKYFYSFKDKDEKISQDIIDIIIKHKDKIHHIYRYKTFKYYKDEYLQNRLDKDIEKEIIQNYINDYPWSPDPIYNEHASIDLIKEDYEWAQAYIKKLESRFESRVVELNEVKKIMQQFVDDKSHSIVDSPPKLNSISIKKYKSFILEDMEFVMLLVKFLKKRPLDYDFKIDKAIESIKKALSELKEENNIFSRKVDFIVDNAKIKLT